MNSYLLRIKMKLKIVLEQKRKRWGGIDRRNIIMNDRIYAKQLNQKLGRATKRF